MALYISRGQELNSERLDAKGEIIVQQECHTNTFPLFKEKNISTLDKKMGR